MEPDSSQRKPQTQPDPQGPKPVAYDQDGRPLYAQPPQPQIVYVSRPHEPVQQEIPPEIQKKHEESVRQYPELHLSAGEYVISAVKRHPVGLLSIWLVVAMVILLVLIGLPILATNQSFVDSIGGQALGALVIILLSLCLLFILGGWIATIVYNGNKFFLTNESVIQFLQHSLFSKKEQTISLSNIEDASYNQHGLLQHMLGYGSLRLSTEGDETTYRFSYATDPKDQINKLNNAIEAFKNGRPFDID